MRIQLPIIALLLVAPNGGKAASWNLGVVDQVPLLLAQASVEAPFDPFLRFLAKVMLLVGVSMVFYGGYRIGRGETSEGLVAIIGGFIVALAVPITRYFATLAGTTF